MEELENLNQDDVLELITDFPIKPLRNGLIITTNSEDMEDDAVDLSGQAFSPVQYVLASGSHNSDILKPGQKIYLNLTRMTVRLRDENNVHDKGVERVQIEPVEAGGRFYGMITDDKVSYLINE